MEPAMYMTGMVLAVGALHLVTRVVTYVSRYHAASKSGRAKSKKVPVHRDDWYMFFHRSDLTGESRDKRSSTRKDNHSDISPGTRQRRDTRTALRRYSA